MVSLVMFYKKGLKPFIIIVTKVEAAFTSYKPNFYKSQEIINYLIK